MDVTEADAKRSLSRLVARNTIVQLVGRALTLALALGSIMVLTRYLGVEGVGNYLLVISFLSLLNFSDMGLLLITVRELSAEKEDPDVLIGNVLVIRVVTAVASMALTVVVALALDYPGDVTAAMILGSLSYIAIAIGSGSLGAVFIANLKMHYQVVANAVQYVTFIVLVGAVVWLELGLISLILAYNVSMFASSATVIAFSRKMVTPRLRLDAALCRRIITAALPAGINTIAWVLYSRIDMVLLSQMKGAEAVGLYGLAYRFVDLAWPIGFFFVGSVYPILSRDYKARATEDFRWLQQRSTDVIALLALGPITVLVVFADPVLRIVGGQEFLAAETTLRILAVAILPLWLGMLSAYTMLALERQVALLGIGIVALIVNVGGNLLLIPSMSYEGSAIATLATEGTALAMMMWVIRSQLGFLPSFRTGARMAPVLAMTAVLAIWVVPDSIPAQAAVVVAGVALAYAISGAISVRTIKAMLGRRVREEPAVYRAASEIGAGR